MSLYRCAECGHGRRLYAYSQAVAYGPVAADGLLAYHESSDDAFLFVDSIQCAVHPDGCIQTKVGTRFHEWDRCERCLGTGKDDNPQSRRYYCPTCGGTGGEWKLPAEAVSA